MFFSLILSTSLLFFQIHIIDFDDENNIINKNVLLHQAGEIWHIGASPADKAVLTTCYNKSESHCFLLSVAPFAASLCSSFFSVCIYYILLFLFPLLMSNDPVQPRCPHRPNVSSCVIYQTLIESILICEHEEPRESRCGRMKVTQTFC